MNHIRKISLFVLGLLMAVACVSQSPLPKVVSGKIERIENFTSDYVTARNVDIWLPDSYSKAKKYAVLYMHDGQMLYDAEQGWNKQSWDVDDTASKLMSEGKVKDFIVVGIWNGGVTRHPDYFPQKPLESLSKVELDTVTAQLVKAQIIKSPPFATQSDNYLKFLTKELKPYIDQNYSVHTDRSNTYVMGSSMGGLISMYAICEYPDIFGTAACLSTHWPGTFVLENNPVPAAFIQYLKDNLPDPNSHRIYFDCGDQTLDALYPDIQRKVDQVMFDKGYSKANWTTEYFPGQAHTEDAWKVRLRIPLEYMLGK
ncbi:alpha/beta hydrolase [Reichenbachiella versicolor]|uniref:alpha/beta hydrolase n=1 Tax=Reichenbachiella versicolor TaxID=1821036 RepID=UPI000D6E657C|nr:alpha/beta hydrolase-fold protein [Reichenbachiella versicolor]